ncbi:MAG TPA: hypothetical protein PKW15_00695 [Alphaproteobacteria bacterium]|nr:hypothetical protein [Rhodospirillaceae bacterium]HRJ11741.1 hypothetical protein [Alphaproteobacteria bacterium]
MNLTRRHTGNGGSGNNIIPETKEAAFQNYIHENVAQLDINTPHGFSKAFFSGALGTLQKKLGMVVSFVQGAFGPRTSSPQPI